MMQEEIMNVPQDERSGRDRRRQSTGQRQDRLHEHGHDEFGTLGRDEYDQDQIPTDRYWGVLENIAPEE